MDNAKLLVPPGCPSRTDRARQDGGYAGGRPETWFHLARVNDGDVDEGIAAFGRTN